MSQTLRWEPAKEEDQPTVQAILDRAPQYRWNVDGIVEAPNDAEESLQALPQGCEKRQKHFMVLSHGGAPIGVADVIRDFPAKGTAMIGLFLLQEDRQRQGLGSAAYFALERIIRDGLCCHRIRLAVVDSNPVQGFWEKLGFALTGEARPHAGAKRSSVKRVMEKALPPRSP
jgi:GNAT superfamily N-acetyltransferase